MVWTYAKLGGINLTPREIYYNRPTTVDGKQNRGKPKGKLRWRDLVKEDMARNHMTTEMAEDRKHWHVMIQAGALQRVEADR